MWQLGTLGAGNHYAEIQVVDEIFNEFSARKMGIEEIGQVCVMIHCGSRGLGHQVATGMCLIVVSLSCPVFESRGNPGVTRESRVTPGLRENSIFKSSNPGVNSG